MVSKVNCQGWGQVLCLMGVPARQISRGGQVLCLMGVPARQISRGGQVLCLMGVPARQISHGGQVLCLMGVPERQISRGGHVLCLMGVPARQISRGGQVLCLMGVPARQISRGGQVLCLMGVPERQISLGGHLQGLQGVLRKGNSGAARYVLHGCPVCSPLTVPSHHLYPLHLPCPPFSPCLPCSLGPSCVCASCVCGAFLSPISSSSSLSSFCVFLSHLPLHCSHHFYYQCLTQCCLLISLPRYLRSLFSVSYCVSCCSS